MDIKGLNPFNALLGQTPKPQRVASPPAVPVARNLGAAQFKAAQSESRRQLQATPGRGRNTLQQMGQLAALSGNETPRNPADAALRRVSGGMNPLRDIGNHLLRPQALSGFAEAAQEQVGPTRVRAQALGQEARQMVGGAVADVQAQAAETVQGVQQQAQEEVQGVVQGLREGAGQAVAGVESQVQAVTQDIQQGVAGVKAQAQQAAGGALGALKDQAQSVGAEFAQVGEQVENLEQQIMMLRPEKVESEVRRVLGQVNELDAKVDQLQAQVNELRQNMSRLGEEKVNALLLTTILAFLFKPSCSGNA
jgi:chromosome segregation ATPase